MFLAVKSQKYSMPSPITLEIINKLFFKSTFLLNVIFYFEFFIFRFFEFIVALRPDAICSHPPRRVQGASVRMRGLEVAEWSARFRPETERRQTVIKGFISVLWFETNNIQTHYLCIFLVIVPK